MSSTIEEGIPASESGYPRARADTKIQLNKRAWRHHITILYAPRTISSCIVDLMAGSVYSEMRFAVIGATKGLYELAGSDGGGLNIAGNVYLFMFLTSVIC
jgi:hypothetical protein